MQLLGPFSSENGEKPKLEGVNCPWEAPVSVYMEALEELP